MGFAARWPIPSRNDWHSTHPSSPSLSLSLTFPGQINHLLDKTLRIKCPCLCVLKSSAWIASLVSWHAGQTEECCPEDIQVTCVIFFFKSSKWLCLNQSNLLLTIERGKQFRHVVHRHHAPVTEFGLGTGSCSARLHVGWLVLGSSEQVGYQTTVQFQAVLCRQSSSKVNQLINEMKSGMITFLTSLILNKTLIKSRSFPC